MIAPATIGFDIPIAEPIPRRATPMVAMVDHELPVANDTSPAITTAENKKTRGDKISKP